MPVEVVLGGDQAESGPPGEVVSPFGASVAGVQALLPEAKLLDFLAAGQRGVTKAQAVLWLVDFSHRVELRMAGWDSLPSGMRGAAVYAARDLVHNAVASYVEAARFPERALDGYAAVLWSRFNDGLTALEAWLGPRLTDVQAGTGADVGQPAHSFPPATFVEAGVNVPIWWRS